MYLVNLGVTMATASRMNLYAMALMTVETTLMRMDVVSIFMRPINEADSESTVANESVLRTWR